MSNMSFIHKFSQAPHFGKAPWPWPHPESPRSRRDIGGQGPELGSENLRKGRRHKKNLNTATTADSPPHVSSHAVLIEAGEKLTTHSSSTLFHDRGANPPVLNVDSAAMLGLLPVA